MVPSEGTAEEVSFEWKHHTISSTDSKVSRLTWHILTAKAGDKWF